MYVGFFSVVSLIFSHLKGWCSPRFGKTLTKFLLKANTKRQQIISGLWRKHHVLPLPSHKISLHTFPFCIPESFFSSSLSHFQLCLNRKVLWKVFMYLQTFGFSNYKNRMEMAAVSLISRLTCTLSEANLLTLPQI